MPSVDSIYREIIQLSRSVGECKSSIEHVEDSMIRSYHKLKESLDKIDSRLDGLEKAESFRQERSKFLWGILNVSPGNILRWSSAVVLVISIIGTIFKIDLDKGIARLLQFVSG